MKRTIKVKDGEDLSASNVERVIAALESDTPITKKEACQMLKITYNTTRLGRIIEEHKDRVSYVEKRKKMNRSKPVDDSDRQYIVQEYLSGTSISEISEGVFRSPLVVKNILKQYNIPIRNKAYNYFSPVDIDIDAWSEDYIRGDLVFSARYNSPAYIDKLIEDSESHGKVYRIWILGDHSQWAVQPYYELADLRKLQQDLKIKISELDQTDIIHLINEGLMKAKKLKRASND